MFFFFDETPNSSASNDALSSTETDYTESLFESIKHINEHGQEFWYARELSKVLEYKDFRNFELIICKAMEACKNSGYEISDHFGETTEMVQIGSGAHRGFKSYQLSRYACYLLVMNGDSSKKIIALGQTYFAVKTRQQELIENFDQLNCNVPHLIKIAILHYQFETIHPFLDGNGRIGRLIIPLYLLSKGILSKPCFYISDYFESHRTEYYDSLNKVRIHNDLMGWIKFFLQAVISTALNAKDKFKKVTAYVHKLETIAVSLGGRSDNMLKVVRAFYDNPILSGKQISNITGLSQPTTDNIIKRLSSKDAHILYELTGYSRNRIFVLWDYLKIFY